MPATKSAPWFDTSRHGVKRPWVVTETNGNFVAHHRFPQHEEAAAWAFSGHEPNLQEDTMSDVTHLGAVGLDVIPLALSERACRHILELLDYDAGSGDEATDAEFSTKIRDELRIARDATLTKGESGGITDSVRKAAGMRSSAIRERDASWGADTEVETEAERIAGKMAKASRDAVEGADDA